MLVIDANTIEIVKLISVYIFLCDTYCYWCELCVDENIASIQKKKKTKKEEEFINILNDLIVYSKKLMDIFEDL